MVKNNSIIEIIHDAMLEQSTCQEDYSLIENMIKKLIRLEKAARTEGLLELEFENFRIAGYSEQEIEDHYETDNLNVNWYCHVKISDSDRMLAEMISLVTNGTDPEIIERIGINRYYTMPIKGKDALPSVMAIIGARAIQDGLVPFVFMPMILSVVPKEIEDKYINANVSNV